MGSGGGATFQQKHEFGDSNEVWPMIIVASLTQLLSYESFSNQ